MKKSLFIIGICFLSSLVLTQSVAARSLPFYSVAIGTYVKNFIAFSDTSFLDKNITDAVKNSSSKTAKEMKRAAKELMLLNRTKKAFEKEFKGVTDVKWFKAEDGYMSQFTQNGNASAAWYSKSGNLLYTMLTYGENKLPRDVRAIVKSTYYDYKITSIQEIREVPDDIPVYLVHLEDDQNLKAVVVCNGEMKVYQEFKKDH